MYLISVLQIVLIVVGVIAVILVILYFAGSKLQEKQVNAEKMKHTILLMHHI